MADAVARLADSTLRPRDPRDKMHARPTAQRRRLTIRSSPSICGSRARATFQALSNAILYGNRERRDRHVHVRAEVDRERLVVEVSDEGAGFDLETAEIDPTSPENLLREDGRGLFLMRRLMDSVERFDARGNVIRMTLRRS